MARGGPRPGAGRKVGSATKKTREIADAAMKDGVSPLEFMLNRMRDPEAPMPDRMKMAEACAPYLHPRLSSVDHSSGDGSMSPLPSEVVFLAPEVDAGDD